MKKILALVLTLCLVVTFVPFSVSAETENYTVGDLDSKTGVTANDAIYLLYNIFFGAARYPVVQDCDFDANGLTETEDAIYLLYYVFFGESRYPLHPESNENDNTQIENFEIPEYTGEAYTVINGNTPYFDESELTERSFESYGALDGLGRCTKTVASVGIDLMPTEERGSIGQVKPTGWQTVKYDCVDGKYLYNRCHLIGFQLTGENANEQNLITGTRYMNVDGMLPFENIVADYVKETENHVMYRVTPVFMGDELLARGVLMEAFSVEDEGEGICFCVFVHNVQPEIEINYADGTSKYVGKSEDETEDKTEDEAGDNYVLNISTKKFHYPSCHSAEIIKESNREDFVGSRHELINMGYSPCGNCDP